LIISFLLFVTALSLADLSFVLPVVSIEVIVNVAFANYFLNEPVSLLRWIGTVLISTGVILVVRSEKQTVKYRKREETPYVKSR
jgi:drug/metabolite transporter (DMT)-like permease